MSHLPVQSAGNHNDDKDEPNSAKVSTLTSRITSPLMLRLQQTLGAQIANNQAYDEIHDLPPKHSSRPSSVKVGSSQELMQSNYYDQTRFDSHAPSASNLAGESGPININLEEYKRVSPFLVDLHRFSVCVRVGRQVVCHRRGGGGRRTTIMCAFLLSHEYETVFLSALDDCTSFDK